MLDIRWIDAMAAGMRPLANPDPFVEDNASVLGSSFDLAMSHLVIGVLNSPHKQQKPSCRSARHAMAAAEFGGTHNSG